MIEAIEVSGYRCLRSVRVGLTPLHAFIGPNDSGKSTLLAAILAQQSRVGIPREPHHSAAQAVFARQSGVEYTMLDPGSNPKAIPLIRKAFLMRLDADAMRRPAQLVPQGTPLWLDERGGGLAGVYDAWMSRDLESFLEVRERFRQRFVGVKALGTENTSAGSKQLVVILTDGTRVPATHMSEGMLYWLAFEALAFTDPLDMLLVEEPENGLHPHRIADVVAMLRALSERGTQVVLATHSPLVVNELRPEEVSVLTRDAATGTRVTPLTATAHFASRSQVYQNGELWLAFANGADELDLVGPRP